MKYFLTVVIVIFSVYPTMIDFLGELHGTELFCLSSLGMYGNGEGFTFVTFMMMYIVGGYIRLHGVNKRLYQYKVLIPAVILNIAIIFAWSILCTKLTRFKIYSAWEYCNPFVISEAAIVFLIFSKMNFKSKIINNLAKGAFSCFLLHEIFMTKLQIENFVNKPTYILLLHMFISAAAIYLVAWFVGVIYDFIMDRIFDRVEKICGDKLSLSFTENK